VLICFTIFENQILFINSNTQSSELVADLYKDEYVGITFLHLYNICHCKSHVLFLSIVSQSLSLFKMCILIWKWESNGAFFLYDKFYITPVSVNSRNAVLVIVIMNICILSSSPQNEDVSPKYHLCIHLGCSNFYLYWALAECISEPPHRSHSTKLL